MTPTEKGYNGKLFFRGQEIATLNEWTMNGGEYIMPQNFEMTCAVKVKLPVLIKWLLKRKQRKWTIQELIERDNGVRK